MRQWEPGSRWTVAALIAVVGLSANPEDARAQSAGDFVPVTDAMLQGPAPEDWLMWRRTLDGWGYSPLDQISPENVGDLRMVWTRALTEGSNQGTPLVYDGVMYMPNPGDVIQSYDAVSGDLRWEYRREHPDDLDEFVTPTLNSINRNIAIHDTLIIDTSADDFVFAPRREIWRGRRRSSTIGRFRPTSRPVRSSPTARSSPVVAACRCPDPMPVSSPPTTRRPARSCGDGEPSQDQVSLETKPGAACRSKSAGTSAPGWCRATTRC